MVFARYKATAPQIPTKNQGKHFIPYRKNYIKFYEH